MTPVRIECKEIAEKKRIETENRDEHEVVEIEEFPDVVNDPPGIPCSMGYPSELENWGKNKYP